MLGSLGGCTVLNSEYANGAGADTDGGSTSNSDTSDSDSHTAGTTEDGSQGGSNSEGTTGTATGDWPTSGRSEGGSSGGFTDTGGVDSDSLPDHVLLIYATTEPFDFPTLDPVPLVEGGVNVDEETIFWTGVVTNCDAWIAEKGTGTVGSPTAVGSGWFNAGSNACSTSRRILCACESIDNPF